MPWVNKFLMPEMLPWDTEARDTISVFKKGFSFLNFFIILFFARVFLSDSLYIQAQCHMQGAVAFQ